MSKESEVGSIDLGEKGYSYKEIVMRALQRAGDSLSVEFRGGYHNEMSGYEIDSREVACSHVHVLTMLLISKFDKIAEKEYNQFLKDFSTLKNNFVKATSCKDNVVLGSDYYLSDKDKFLLEEFKINKLELHIKLFKDMSLLLGRKKFLEMGGGTF